MIDRRERIADPEEILRIAMDGAQSKLWTALPGIIFSFDSDAMTCKVKPSIAAYVTDETGNTSEESLPVLNDCPVVFPGGGGATLTFPIKPGDECLVVFASRCIDSWWQLGGVRGQAEIRMHDLSDGFVLPGVRSQPRKFSVSTTAAQLRSDDGAAYVEINPTSHNIKALTSGDIEATAAGQITMNAPVVTINAPQIVLNGQVTQGQGSNGGNCSMQGPLHVVDTVTSDTDVIGGGKHLKTHVHSGVQTGGGNTGQPV